MKRSLLAATLLLAAVLLPACKRGEVYPIRWVYLSTGLDSDTELERVKGLIRTGAEHGLSGIYLSSGFDALDLKDEAYLNRLHAVRSFCDSLKMDIAARCMDVGYNGSLFAHNPNLAEGMPVSDALFVAGKTEAVLSADPAVSVPNGGFEETEGDKASGFQYGDSSAGCVFVDNAVAHTGKSSLRIENLDKSGEGAGLLKVSVTVSPNRCYRLRAWVKVEAMGESQPFGSGNLRLTALGADNRQLNYRNIPDPKSSEWLEARVGFNSFGNDKVTISFGVQEKTPGRVWIDDLAIEEIGLVNVLRRPGTPLAVRGEKNGTEYAEGRDFAPVADPLMDFDFTHDGPPIKLLPGSRIKPGERLRVSWYHGTQIYNDQVTTCMSEPEVYEIWRRNVPLIKEHLNPKYYFLNVDEVRVGGTCKACRDRNLTMGQIIGDCVQKQVEIVRQVDPQADIVIWSDMFDPNHNANTRHGDNYYLCAGNYEKSWEYLPKGLIIACWYHEMRVKSLAHFSGLGYRTMACGYYDADNLEADKTWLEALDATPGALGIMYTSWLDKFELLPAFGDLVSQPRKRTAGPLPAR
jgi:hypothetical protein